MDLDELLLMWDEKEGSYTDKSLITRIYNKRGRPLDFLIEQLNRVEYADAIPFSTLVSLLHYRLEDEDYEELTQYITNCEKGVLMRKNHENNTQRNNTPHTRSAHTKPPVVNNDLEEMLEKEEKQPIFINEVKRLIGMIKDSLYDVSNSDDLNDILNNPTLFSDENEIKGAVSFTLGEFFNYLLCKERINFVYGVNMDMPYFAEKSGIGFLDSNIRSLAKYELGKRGSELENTDSFLWHLRNPKDNEILVGGMNLNDNNPISKELNLLITNPAYPFALNDKDLENERKKLKEAMQSSDVKSGFSL